MTMSAGRQIAIAITGLCALAPASASAALVGNASNAQDVWEAMSDIEPIAAQIVGGNAAQLAESDTALAGFPRQGSTFQVFSTGDATLADDPGSATTTGTDFETESANPSSFFDQGSGAVVYDQVAFKATIPVPEKFNCLTADFGFLTDETSPEAVDTGRDSFMFETSQTSSLGVPSFINAQDAALSTALSTENAAGTTYDSGTTRLRAYQPVQEGIVNVLFYTWDAGDGFLDSAAFVDRVVLDKNPDCTAGYGLPIPTTEITKKPPRKTDKRRATFEFKSPSDPESTFECSVDNQEFATCPSPFTTAKLARTRHTFQVRAVLEGREDASPAKATWTIK